MVLILTIPPNRTDLIVSTHPCSSAWNLPNESCMTYVNKEIKNQYKIPEKNIFCMFSSYARDVGTTSIIGDEQDVYGGKIHTVVELVIS